MTTPSIFAPGVTATSGKEKQESVLIDKRTYNVPASTAADTIIGMIRFYKGMHLNLNTLGIAWDDLDDSGSATIDVGWAYDDNTTYADDPNGLIDGNDATSAGQSATLETTGIAWALLENGAPEDGWITIAIRDAATSKAGDVTVAASFAYGIPPTNVVPG
jgi:hypothetical protein